MKIQALFCGLLICGLLVAQKTSNEKNLAFALPLKNIKVDGDLSDWPLGGKKYGIDRPIWRSSNTDTEDYQATFRVGYDSNSNALLIAVETTDEQIVSNPESIELGDLYAFFLDESHHQRGSGIIRYKVSELHKSISGPEEMWDPDLKEVLNWENIDYALNKNDSGLIYEIAVRLREPIFNKRIIGFGHLIQDVDLEKETVYSWNGRGNKDYNNEPGRLGNIMFLEEWDALGRIEGKVGWKDSQNTFPINGIKIVSKDDERIWLYVPMGDKDVFKTNIPAGNYYLKPGKNAFFDGDAFAKVDDRHLLNFSVGAKIVTKLPNYQLVTKGPAWNEFYGNALKVMSPSDKNQIDEAIVGIMDHYLIEGVDFASFDIHNITYNAQYGVKNNFTKEPVDESTLFEVASITKPVFAFAVLRLYERGIIDLDKPLVEYLPWSEVQNQEWAKLLTARMVLSHQTGLPNWGDMQFYHAPGTAFSYSGSAYQYLGRVLEHVTNKDMNSILNEEVVQPLKLEHFYFQEHPYAFKHKANGHYNGFPSAIDVPEKPWIAGCLITNARSLSKFIMALGQRKGLQPSTYDLMFAPAAAVPKDSQENNWGFEEYMGLGLFFEKGPNGLVLRHSGNNGDFKCTFRYYENLKKGYVILTNGNTGDFILDKIEKVLVSY
ncbi:MAG: serine hydrolase [Bacteroidota bacterium]